MPPPISMDVPFAPTDTRVVTQEEITLAERRIRRAFNDHTLCDIIRQMYEIADNLDDVSKKEIQNRCLIAYSYAKRMDKKLVEYKAKEKNSNG